MLIPHKIVPPTFLKTSIPAFGNPLSRFAASTTPEHGGIVDVTRVSDKGASDDGYILAMPEADESLLRVIDDPKSIKRHRYYQGMYGFDARYAAQRAWDEGALVQYALAVGANGSFVDERVLTAVTTLEVSWQEYYDQHKLPLNADSVLDDRFRTKIENKLRHKCIEWMWDLSDVTADDLFAKCSDNELKSLYSLALFMDFFEKQGVEFNNRVQLDDFFAMDNPQYLCTTITLVMLSLQRFVTDEFPISTLRLQAHTMAVMALNQGVEIYINNGQQFLPPGFFDMSRGMTSYNSRSNNQNTLPEWGIMTSIHTNLGNSLEEQGDNKNAIKHFRAALRIDPDNTSAHISLGDSLIKQGDNKNGIKHFREALRIDPDDVCAHTKLGFVFTEQRDFKSGIRHFNKALRTDPDNVCAHHNLGFIFTKQGDLESAMMHYMEALRINPDSAHIHDNLGVVFTKQGDFENAIRHYREVLKIDPNNTVARQEIDMLSLRL